MLQRGRIVESFSYSDFWLIVRGSDLFWHEVQVACWANTIPCARVKFNLQAKHIHQFYELYTIHTLYDAADLSNELPSGNIQSITKQIYSDPPHSFIFYLLFFIFWSMAYYVYHTRTISKYVWCVGPEVDWRLSRAFCNCGWWTCFTNAPLLIHMLIDFF